jgi:hypothetical protein
LDIGKQSFGFVRQENAFRQNLRSIDCALPNFLMRSENPSGTCRCSASQCAIADCRVVSDHDPIAYYWPALSRMTKAPFRGKVGEGISPSLRRISGRDVQSNDRDNSHHVLGRHSLPCISVNRQDRRRQNA